MTTLITIDNGGTLTDVCVMDGDSLTYTKTLTTPHDLSRCLFDGLSRVAEATPDSKGLAGLLRSADYIRYSTTQGTNALVQRQGPRLGLLVADPELPGRLLNEPDAADLYEVLVGDRSRVLDLTLSDEELTASLVSTCNALAGAGASRLVIAIGGHDGVSAESRVRALLLSLYPRQLLGAVPLLFSNELVGGDPDDVRRTWSSLLNAFLHPAMERFLFNAEDRLRSYRTRNPLLVFRNDGASSRVAKSSAIKTYSSGPRGGVEGTRSLSRQYDLDRVVMMDVGGTTTDIAVVENGSAAVDRHGRIAGVTTSLPLARIESHGVGGSSVFRVAEGAVVVGPDSVGAAPGPACFGLGGHQATITDVLLLTGVLDARTYLGGTLSLDASKAEAVVRSSIAEPLGLELGETLARMLDAYANRLSETLSPVAEAGTTVAAFGGAGPMSVCAAARRAGVTTVIIPRSAAVFSAFGIGFSDIGHAYTAIVPPGADADALSGSGEQLLSSARRDMFAEGLELDDCQLAWSVLTDDDVSTPIDVPAAAYGVLGAAGGRLQLDISSMLPHPQQAADSAVTRTAAVTSGERVVQLDASSVQSVDVVHVADQSPGAEIHGPAVLEGPFFTMLLPLGWLAEITASGDLRLTDETPKETRR